MEVVPPQNSKLNVFCILGVLDKLHTYANCQEKLYDDLKLVIDATEGKTVEAKSTDTNRT